MRFLVALGLLCCLTHKAYAECPYDFRCNQNPYGSGNRHNSETMNNSGRQYSNPYGTRDWQDPFRNEQQYYRHDFQDQYDYARPKPRVFTPGPEYNPFNSNNGSYSSNRQQENYLRNNRKSFHRDFVFPKY